MNEMVDQMDHISLNLRKQLKRTLHKYPDLFSGGLGTLKGVDPVHLEVEEKTKPYHSREFPIPRAYQETTKKEIKRLCSIGVLQKTNNLQWAAPTFIQPKKTGNVRVLPDF